jgi:hypothetical protein
VPANQTQSAAIRETTLGDWIAYDSHGNRVAHSPTFADLESAILKAGFAVNEVEVARDDSAGSAIWTGEETIPVNGD